jgi:hypothetical protein
VKSYYSNGFATTTFACSINLRLVGLITFVAGNPSGTTTSHFLRCPRLRGAALTVRYCNTVDLEVVNALPSTGACAPRCCARVPPLDRPVGMRV